MTRVTVKPVGIDYTIYTTDATNEKFETATGLSFESSGLDFLTT
jgi:hypothetical protein